MLGIDVGHILVGAGHLSAPVLAAEVAKTELELWKILRQARTTAEDLGFKLGRAEKEVGKIKGALDRSEEKQKKLKEEHEEANTALENLRTKYFNSFPNMDPERKVQEAEGEKAKVEGEQAAQQQVPDDDWDMQLEDEEEADEERLRLYKEAQEAEQKEKNQQKEQNERVKAAQAARKEQRKQLEADVTAKRAKKEEDAAAAAGSQNRQATVVP